MTPISVCIIGKNEENHIENCLTLLRKYDWEIVVANTGSTDRTREIALQYADQVLDYTWADDFSAARNFTISHATHDSILILDCDEYLTDIDLDEVSRFFREHPDLTGCITIRSIFPSTMTKTVSVSHLKRAFNRTRFSFRFPIHEQIVPIKAGHQPDDSLLLPVTVIHHGYDLNDEEKAKKAKRNNDLLFTALKKEPMNPYLLFQIGQSYALMEDRENACIYFRKSLALNDNPAHEYVHTMLTTFGYSLLYTNQVDEALALIHTYRARYDTSDFCCLAGTAYLESRQYLKAMGEFLKAMNCDKFNVEDTRHDIPLYHMGYINELLGNSAAALRLYKSCHNFPLAGERIRYLEGDS